MPYITNSFSLARSLSLSFSLLSYSSFRFLSSFFPLLSCSLTLLLSFSLSYFLAFFLARLIKLQPNWLCLGCFLIIYDNHTLPIFYLNHWIRVLLLLVLSHQTVCFFFFEISSSFSYCFFRKSKLYKWIKLNLGHCDNSCWESDDFSLKFAYISNTHSLTHSNKQRNKQKIKQTS